MKEEETQAKTRVRKASDHLLNEILNQRERRTSTKRKILSLVRPDNEKNKYYEKVFYFF